MGTDVVETAQALRWKPNEGWIQLALRLPGEALDALIGQDRQVLKSPPAQVARGFSPPAKVACPHVSFSHPHFLSMNPSSEEGPHFGPLDCATIAACGSLLPLRPLLICGIVILEDDRPKPISKCFDDDLGGK